MTADEPQDAPADSSPNTGAPVSPPPVPPAPPPPPVDPIADLAQNLALADALKPLEGPFNDVYGTTADKVAARQKLADAYKAAVAPGGSLKTKFDAAIKAFNRDVLDMDNDGLLQKWLDWGFAADSPISKILVDRKTFAKSVAEHLGKNEKERTEAQAVTKAWAARYADWSAPVDKITVQIGQYADKIDTLNTAIHNGLNGYAAMTSFWFEVASKHLQLAPDLDAGVQAVVDKVADKLKTYLDLKEMLTIGPKRTDGSLFLVSTADSAAKWRRDVLDSWKARAIDQANVEAAFKIHPDDAASDKQSYDKFKDDGWIAEAKKIPEPTPQP
jgi:hypothetical protein